MRTTPARCILHLGLAFGWLQLNKPPPGVVAAEHKFAKRRLEHLNTWKLTRDELSKLRGLVNQKAGHEIM